MAKYLSKIFHIISASKLQLVSLLLLFIISSLLEAFGIGLIGPFLGIASKPETVKDIQLLNWIYTQTNLQSYHQFIPLVGLAVAAIFLIKAFIYLLSKVYVYKFSFDQKGKLCSRLLNTYLSVPYTFHLSRNTSSLISNIVVETEKFGGSLLSLLEIISNSIIIVTLLTLLFITNSLLLVLILAVLFPLVFIFLKLSKIFSVWGKGASEAQKEIIRIINHSLGGIKETRVIGCEPYFNEQMRHQTRTLEKFKVLYHSSLILPKTSIETCTVLAIIFFTSIFSLSQSSGEEEIVAILSVFAVASIRLVPTVSQLLTGVGNLRNFSYAINMLYLDLKEIERIGMVQSRSSASSPNIFCSVNEAVGSQTLSFSSRIDLSHISYNYPGTKELAISDISISIEKGKSIALIGKSGAGKTTLVDIILGLLKPERGDIYVDGVSVYRHLRAWQNLVGYIPQSIFLIDDTIERNIAFGIPDHLIDTERLGGAIEAAQLSELIAQLPNGVKTSVGERGVRLSGGQRQRIGIARALYHEREILVLDEATSALDSETENLVTEAIRSLSGQKTMIIIAHRLSTVEHCDCVYMMDKGYVVKSGSYQEVVVAS
ncbi:MAG: ATP-binding cassette domain-containing protein [Cyanobacteria bacterium CRU_2_1]|nr:ATP-binding cassette domain-containing protein [Cyanobacteria bacterium CRU_2_1]